MRHDLITTNEAIPALREEWEALWRRAGARPFQSPAWLLPWWSIFGTAHPRIAALRDEGGTLRALLPLYRLEEAGTAKLLPMGVGITDYTDALLDPEAPPDAVTHLLATALASETAPCDLPDLPPDAALLAAPPPQGWRAETWPGEPCPVLTLPDSIEALRGPISSNTLRKLRMSRHRADRAGGWSATTARPEDVPALWEHLVALHQSRWTRKGEEGGVLADPKVLAFHRTALPELQAAGALRLHALKIGGETAAVFHTLAGPDRLHLYIGGFDETRAFESPGTLLLGHLIESAVTEGLREVHFLRGAEPYKYSWGAQDRPNTGRRLTRA
ncbi:GNAT family N-acetyltransferase [Pararoseomonas indoligenes]|uniref:GNAT family N-acetyltransferase n=1 Tax=Roseomonas indoligenes TaxID=2820811 RepID=A0A940S5Y3_9PROT|nr:GNAT family N-acetyltransferase [Pararoseomonas indoligenes]MBP0494921.1 GNAT family N-acetyltransferase [Pararoseomonas indoligenes]